MLVAWGQSAQCIDLIALPNVAYGHMSDTVQLSYQAAMVSFHSPTYGRQWLSTVLHLGSTVACTQAEAMVCAAEAKTGVRLWRRTDLLAQRVAQAETERRRWATKTAQAEHTLTQAQNVLQETLQQLQDWQDRVTQYEVEYKERQRPERPHSQPAQAHANCRAYVRLSHPVRIRGSVAA